MKFKIVAEYFESLEQETKRLKITHLLAELLEKVSPEEAAIIAYLSLGDVQAVYQKTQFNFAEKSMIKVIARLTKKTQTQTQLSMAKMGDLGLVLAENYTQIELTKELSVLDVHNKLLHFLSITGIGSQEAKEQDLYDFLEQLDPISGKYIVRVIIGKLRLGFSDMTLLDAFSWMQTGDKSIRKELEHAYNVSVDIGLIIKILKEKWLAGIKKISITPGIPIRPAAAERLSSAQAIVKKLGPCIAQPKLDGFRLQVHIDKTKQKHVLKFFSRNLQDMSAMFPDLTKALEDINVKTLVAEGEAIGYDIETQSFLPFQETVKRKRKYDIEQVAQAFPLKLYFFDVLYLDGASLLDASHEDRRKKLAKILDTKKIEKDEILYLIEEKKIEDADTLDDYFQQNISSGLEGLVIKRPDAIYQPGKRNFNWIKFKRKETGELDDTIDCIILGYYFGHGKRASFGIGALLVGVFNEKQDTIQTVAKIGTGLTDKEWKDQKKACDKIAVQRKPNNVECAKELYPDVWVTPKLICVIRADEITRSPLHTAGETEDQDGLALRFPRLMGYREDKSVPDATSVKELEHLFSLQFGKSKKSRKKKARKKTDETNMTIGDYK